MTLRRRTELQRRVPLVSRRRLVAKTPLKRGGDLKRTSPLASVTPIDRKAPMKRGRVKAKLTREQGSALAARSGGVCEMQTEDCTYVAVDPCHRVGEGAGGRHGEAAEVNDRLSNLLAGCRRCHDWCHRNPVAAEAERFIVRRGVALPATVPVHYRRTSWRLLADDGTWEPCAAPVEDVDLPEVGT